MELLQQRTIGCPYCGESIAVVVDGSIPEQEYIEDCQVCCRPIVIRAIMSVDGRCRVDARHEDES